MSLYNLVGGALTGLLLGICTANIGLVRFTILELNIFGDDANNLPLALLQVFLY